MSEENVVGELVNLVKASDDNFNYCELWPDLLFELNRLLEDRHGITLKDAAAGIESTVGHWPRHRYHD